MCSTHFPEQISRGPWGIKDKVLRKTLCYNVVNGWPWSGMVYNGHVSPDGHHDVARRMPWPGGYCSQIPCFLGFLPYLDTLDLGLVHLLQPPSLHFEPLSLSMIMSLMAWFWYYFIILVNLVAEETCPWFKEAKSKSRSITFFKFLCVWMYKSCTLTLFFEDSCL